MTESSSSALSTTTQAFDFGAEHNGVSCIASTRPEDRGTSRQYWFTRQMLAELFNVSDQTVTNRIKALVEWEELSETKNFASAKIPMPSGAKETTLYDLHVFNKLAMDLRTPKARELKSKFSDILVKHETGTVANALPQSYAEALRALADEVEKHEQTRNALIAEQEQHEKDNEDYRNGLAIIEKQKIQISTKRESTAMNTAKREKRRAELAEAETKRVKEENERLKNELGIGIDFIKTSQARDKWIEIFHHEPSGNKLVDICKKNGLDYKEKCVPDIAKIYGLRKQVFVNAYPREAWMIYYKEELQAKARMLPLG